MSVHRLTPVDAQSFWTAAKIPNDTILLFAFDGVAADVDAAIAEVRARAGRCTELTVRIADSRSWAYPAWVECGVDETQFAVHDLDEPTWSRCLSAVSH